MPRRLVFWFTVRRAIRHPVDAWYIGRKRRSVPRPGERVRDCRGQVHAVVSADEDDLLLDDGSRFSWFHCCTRVSS